MFNLLFIIFIFINTTGNYKIGKITVSGNHWTKEFVIKRELLLRENESYDSLKIEESERNLRKLGYFQDTEIVEECDTVNKMVDLIVKVKEVWHIYPVPIPPSGGGGYYYAGGLLTDVNFMGMGQNVGLFFFYTKMYRENFTSHLTNFWFTEPRLFGTRWQIGLNSAININPPRGGLYRGLNLSLTQPLYSKEVKWAMSFGLNYGFTASFWYNAEPIKYYGESKGASFNLTRSFGLLSKKDVSFGVSASKVDYPDAPSMLKDSLIYRKTIGIFGHVSLYKENYMKQRFIDELGRTEDIRLGHYFNFELEPHNKALGSKRDELELSTSLSYTYKILGLIFKDALSFSSDLTRDSLLNTVVTNELKSFYKLPLNQTLAVRLRLCYIKNYEPPSPYRLGGSNGLRGYPANELGGEKELLVNMEDRIILINTPSFVFGPVLFLDIGGYFDQKIVKSVGLGVRFTFPRFLCPVLRIDYAYPLDATKIENWSFGINQTFTINPLSFNISVRI
ncbi:MAG: POTRA domain-containing protein [bacterium]|nr:POTRA domain-containing protein [bacterium]